MINDGYVPSLAEFEDMAAQMDRDHYLFQGRMIQGRVVNGAFVADREEDRLAIEEAVRENLRDIAPEWS